MLNTINTKIFFLINNLAGKSHLFDSIFVFITNTGFNLVLAFVLIYIFIIYPFQKNNPVERFRAWGQALLITGSTFVTWGFVWIIKVLVSAPRPFEILSNVHQLVQESSMTSFPSNHAGLSFALAISTYLHHKRLGTFLFIVASIVSFSRIYVGVHFPVDVIFGALIGVVVPLAIISVFKPYKQ